MVTTTPSTTYTLSVRWTAAHSYFLLSILFLLAGAASAVVDRLGLPMVYVFSGLCSLSLVLGALEAKKDG